MSHGFELKPAVAGIDPDTPALLRPLARALHLANQAMAGLGNKAIALKRAKMQQRDDEWQ